MPSAPLLHTQWSPRKVTNVMGTQAPLHSPTRAHCLQFPEQPEHLQLGWRPRYHHSKSHTSYGPCLTFNPAPVYALSEPHSYSSSPSVDPVLFYRLSAPCSPLWPWIPRASWRWLLPETQILSQKYLLFSEAFSGHSSHASPTITCHQVGFLPAHILHYTYYLPYEYLQGNFDQNNRQQNTSLRVMKKTYNMTGTVSSTSVLTIPLERGVWPPHHTNENANIQQFSQETQQLNDKAGNKMQVPSHEAVPYQGAAGSWVAHSLEGLAEDSERLQMHLFLQADLHLWSHPNSSHPGTLLPTPQFRIQILHHRCHTKIIHMTVGFMIHLPPSLLFILNFKVGVKLEYPGVLPLWLFFVCFCSSYAQRYQDLKNSKQEVNTNPSSISW